MIAQRTPQEKNSMQKKRDDEEEEEERSSVLHSRELDYYLVAHCWPADAVDVSLSRR